MLFVIHYFHTRQGSAKDYSGFFMRFASPHTGANIGQASYTPLQINRLCTLKPRSELLTIFL